MSDALASRLLEVREGLCAELQREHPAVIVEKETDLLSGAIAWSLDRAAQVKSVASLFGVDIPLAAPSGLAFLTDFATTIANRIAVPAAWLTPAQAATALLVLPHEYQHVKQFNDGVKAGKWPRIATHSVLYLAGVVAHTPDGEEYVGKVEGDAYAVTESIRQFLSSAPAPIEYPLASIRRSYNLLGHGTVQAEDVLRSHYATMAGGTCPNVWAARVCREWLYKHAGDLRGKVAL